MATLVFDVETVGADWDDFDDTTHNSLTRWIDVSERSEEEKLSLHNNVKKGLALSPLTGFIASVGVYDMDRKQGAVYYTGNEDSKDEQMGEFVLKQRSEKEILEDFWEGALSYDTFVTFNGRGFDVPFLLHRSVVHGTMPTRDLLYHRYLNQQIGPYHVDLQDQLTFYGAMYRKPSLHLFCNAYGIESSKRGVDGADVAKFFRTKKFRDIARYNAEDVIATTALYEKWFTYLAPESFKNLQIS